MMITETKQRAANGRFSVGNTLGNKNPPRCKKTWIEIFRKVINEEAFELLITKCYEMALEGDRTAMKLIMDKTLPNKVELEFENKEQLSIKDLIEQADKTN